MNPNKPVVMETSRPVFQGFPEIFTIFQRFSRFTVFAHLKVVTESFNKAIDKITGDDALRAFKNC